MPEAVPAAAAPVSVWRIATQGPAWQATDLDGKGMAIHGGRWNRPSVPMVYCASSIALACLETVVHLNAAGLPIRRYLIEVQIPADLWAAAETAQPPTGWDARPDSPAAADYGTRWARSLRSAVLRVPSVIIPQEANYLLNPAHPDTARITAVDHGRFVYDGRLLGR
ncbi:MAG: RES family NAD+ phosphorylase [Comamonas sp.]